ncbi:MAG: C/D box methylation guide ribonucleoprotein complex aNOP56 subunit [Candidatus Hodarchaeota archaeon]
MLVYVLASIAGIFGLDENGNVIGYVSFPRSPEEIAHRISLLQEGGSINELENLIGNLVEKKVEEIIVENVELAKGIRKIKDSPPVRVSKEGNIPLLFRQNVVDMCIDAGFASSENEFASILYETSMFLARSRVKKASERRDQLVKQAIEAIDDLDKSLNVFASRIREWYSLHFPELDELLSSHETFVRTLYKIGLRERYDHEKLAKIGLSEEHVKKIMERAQTSIGAKIVEEDLNPIEDFGGNIISLYRLRRKLEDYVDKVMIEVAPNLRELAGPLLGARLISLAGGIDALSRLPASTIQVLGAEKALFRSLKSGSRPPKHGVIFQHPMIHSAPRWQRGKIARTLAGKLSIAIKVDAFSGNAVADDLMDSIEKRIEEIRRKYPKAPPRKARKKEVRKREKKRKPRMRRK